MQRSSFFSIKDIFQDRRKLTVFSVCVVLSALSWIMISLGREYNTTLVVPLKYVNFPENKTLLNDVPDQLAVNVSGSGFSLLQFDDRLTDDTLLVNLDNLKLNSAGEFLRGYLDQSEISRELQDRLNGVLAINRVLSDSINFIFDLKVSRIFKVKPSIGFTLPKGYVQYDSIQTDPAEVEVYGALSVLDTMRFIKTKATDIGEIRRSQRVRVPLDMDLVGNEAIASVDSVNVELYIDQLTENRFLIEPTLLNVPDSLIMLTFPSSIELVAQVPLSQYDKVTETDFKVVVDYDRIQNGYMVLPVDLETWPPIVEKVTMKPQQVEIVISPKE